MAKNRVDIPHSRINAIHFFETYTRINSNDLSGKKVYDLSAGSGYIAKLFENVGADVKMFDLFPEQNQFAFGKCEFIDLEKKLPLPDECADVVLCCETIECIPNQFQLFEEFSRILRPGGILILTTANPSSLRGRLSQFISEGEHYSMPIPNEFNAVVRWSGNDRGYFSKVFISGVLRLRTLSAIAGLKIKNIHPSPRSATAYLLVPLFFPLIYFFSRKSLRKQVKNDPINQSAYQEIFDINTSFSVLLGKHLIVEFQKKI